LWADVSLIAIPFKGKRVLHATWRNITREKQMEQDFQTQIERFLAIADNSRFATVLVDAGGRWIYTNAKFKGLLGYDLYDIPDEAAWFLAAYPDSNYRSMVLKKCREAMKGNGQDPSLREGREFTVTMTCKDKTQKLIHATLVRMPTGECLKTFMDVTEEQRMKEGLKRTQAQLVMKSAQLRGLNAAMKVLLRSRHDAQVEMELSITENINKLILPVIGELKKHHLDAYSVTRVEMIEQNIQNVVSPFLHNLTTKYSGLTLREMQISDLVKSGRSTKEIAQALRISQSAVSFHRSNIRRKIGITNQKTSLPTYLSRHRDGE
jgi:PAS domain S-box-containing protein